MLGGRPVVRAWLSQSQPSISTARSSWHSSQGEVHGQLSSVRNCLEKEEKNGTEGSVDHEVHERGNERHHGHDGGNAGGDKNNRIVDDRPHDGNDVRQNPVDR